MQIERYFARIYFILHIPNMRVYPVLERLKYPENSASLRVVDVVDLVLCAPIFFFLNMKGDAGSEIMEQIV